ncbi:hypothetical protein BJ742DRAFT_518059 [Cladochytrium replicatum]|nr:hypothetical protein BJ742DRAFT_518059 [Cladochytrium replicatum]
MVVKCRHSESVPIPTNGKRAVGNTRSSALISEQPSQDVAQLNSHSDPVMAAVMVAAVAEALSKHQQPDMGAPRKQQQNFPTPATPQMPQDPSSFYMPWWPASMSVNPPTPRYPTGMLDPMMLFPNFTMMNASNNAAVAAAAAVAMGSVNDVGSLTAMLFDPSFALPPPHESPSSTNILPNTFECLSIQKPQIDEIDTPAISPFEALSVSSATMNVVASLDVSLPSPEASPKSCLGPLRNIPTSRKHVWEDVDSTLAAKIECETKMVDAPGMRKKAKLHVEPFASSRCVPSPASDIDVSTTPRDSSREKPTKANTPYDDRYGFDRLVCQARAGRLGRWEGLRVLSALAQIRPSFIARQASLSKEDMELSERCFQRSIIELEFAMSVSGTPTAVWRPNGEVVLVGLEFEELTGWKRERIFNIAAGTSTSQTASSSSSGTSSLSSGLEDEAGKPAYPPIPVSGPLLPGTKSLQPSPSTAQVGDATGCDNDNDRKRALLLQQLGLKKPGPLLVTELMDGRSSAIYWEQFSKIVAPENQIGSGISFKEKSTIVRPDGGHVVCATCFTVKLDLFGVPALIVGNFLPIGR